MGLSSEPMQLLDHLVRLARDAGDADYAELSIGEISHVQLADDASAPRALDREELSNLFVEPMAGPVNGRREFPGYDDGSYALYPITGPSAEAGWLLLLSTDRDVLDKSSIDRLTSAAALIERHLDQVVERVRLDQISDVLRENQNELRNAQVSLQISNSELEQFAYIAAHELISPLRSVVVYADLLHENVTNLDEVQVQNCADEIRRSVSLMDQQLHYLLELSSTQREAADPIPVDLNEVVQGALDNLQDPLAEAKITVDIGELPVVSGRPVLLQSVFVNLISNAVKYRDPSKDILISITAESDADGSKIFVSDTGPGIEEEHRERIFQLFERASTSTSGSGIGLGLSRRILEAFGGTISYSAPEQGGSLFTLTFPTTTPSE